jgi:hypothetical protein
MLFTIVGILAIAALVFVLANMASQAWAPLWMAVLLLTIIQLLNILPLK